MAAAVECVREIFPNASIRTTRRRHDEDAGVSHPCVVIEAAFDALDGGDGGATGGGKNDDSTSTGSCSRNVWSGRQKNLLQRNPKRRRKSINDMRKKLKAFLDDWAKTGQKIL